MTDTPEPQETRQEFSLADVERVIRGPLSDTGLTTLTDELADKLMARFRLSSSPREPQKDETHASQPHPSQASSEARAPQTGTPETQETRQELVDPVDVDAWALDFIGKAQKYPSIIYDRHVIAGWFRSVIQAYALATYPPHPETPQGDGYSMDEAEKARWASFRTEATAAARKLRDIDRAHVDGKMDESIHDGLLEAADLLDIFGRPIVVMTASQPPPEALRADLSNHHNAAECPYCRPKLDAEIRRTRELIESRDAQTEALRAEALEHAIRIVESEEELDGPMPEENRRLAEQLGSEAHARAVVRSTKRSIARRLRALSASPAPHTERRE